MRFHGMLLRGAKKRSCSRRNTSDEGGDGDLIKTHRVEDRIYFFLQNKFYLLGEEIKI
jgi:hypothetical protein